LQSILLFVHEKRVAVAFPLLSCFGYFLNQLQRPATAGKLRRFILVDEKVAHSIKRLAEFRYRRLRDRGMAADSGSFDSVPDFRSVSTQRGGYRLHFGVNDCTAPVRNWSSLFLKRMLKVVSDP